VTRPNIGDTVYYLSGTETYRFIRRGIVEENDNTGCSYLEGWEKSILWENLYATEEEAKAARTAYYERETAEAQRELDNARARLSNAVGWLERARQEQEGSGEG
jgi:hypothetical protein